MARVMLPHLHLLKMSPNSSNYLDTLGVWSSELDLEYIKRRNEAQALLKEWIRQNEESGKIWQNAKNLNFRNSGNNIYKKTTSIHGLSKKQQIQQSITNSQALRLPLSLVAGNLPSQSLRCAHWLGIRPMDYMDWTTAEDPKRTEDASPWKRCRP